MADASKLKRRTSLGAPPPVEEASHNLHEPEIARMPTERIDGRTLRRSGRTIQFATRVSPEFDARLRQIAQRDGLLLVEVLERALDAYEATR
ncbi:MAG: hypothetical protein U1F76_23070 [Candidatus Competibacteraceae bacterium]